MDYQFNTDCEGPISKNDNAFELAQHFIPRGDELFAKLSKYDDVLADVVKKPGYKAGDTLKLILPFLKAYGVTEASIIEFSSHNILLVPKADIALRYINSIMPAFIISTSYHPYINALCNMISFPYENTYSTRLSIDNYELPKREIQYLKELHNEIIELPGIEIPSHAKSLSDLRNESIICIERLDKIFWEEFPMMVSGKLMNDVNPIGGFEKANAVKESCKKTGLDPSKVMYTGDSITDAEAMKFVKNAGGIAISFNGNRYAIQSAEYACLSSDSLILAVLANLFNRGASIKELAYNWDSEKSKIENEFKLYFPEFSLENVLLCYIENPNSMELISKSESFRKTVRGEKIGQMG